MKGTKRNTVFGFRNTDLLGIAIMIIPVCISQMSFDLTNRVIPFIPWITKTSKYNINPSLISAFLSAAFYISLIVRYGIFKRNTIMEAIISSIRTFLNCWCIAALLSIVITHGNSLYSVHRFELNTSSILLFAVIFSWTGMKTLSGYSWIVFVLAAIAHAQQVDAAMGRTGAVFIITFAISMLLQIENYTNIQEFANDFRMLVNKSSMRDNMGAAMNDAKTRIEDTAQTISKTIIK